MKKREEKRKRKRKKKKWKNKKEKEKYWKRNGKIEETRNSKNRHIRLKKMY